MTKIAGRRVYPDKGGVIRFASGDYGKDPSDGKWYARPPGQSMSCASDTHTVTEHEDGTISITPSIVITDPPDIGVVVWHGHLERGIWKIISGGRAEGHEGRRENG